jgi:hypothetical protein
MRARTLALYLIGNRQAILDIAADRRAIWVGLVFVLSAGFAREYDGQDLLREPWYLLIPIGASLAASLLLFLITCGQLFFRRRGRPPFFQVYQSFLTLFWMTAPLAWLYAVPYERFLSPGGATKANLWTLALVAAWRVALMVRVVSVITGRNVLYSICLVMLFADVAAITAVSMIPQPVINVMGGVRHNESEIAISNATFLVVVLGIISAPLWVSGALTTAWFVGKPAWQVPARHAEIVSQSWGMWIIAALSLAIWLPILPWTQAEQQLRSQAEDDLKAGRIAEALDMMSAHAQSDFPPQWEPPPRVGYGEKSPHIFDVMEVLLSRDFAPWVRACYLDKFRHQLGKAGDEFAFNWYTSEELAALLRILKQLPDGPDIAAEYRMDLEYRLHRTDRDLDAPERADLEALLKLGEKGVPPEH